MLKADLDQARRDLAAREGAVTGARTARSTYDEQSCDAFQLGSSAGPNGHRFIKARPQEPACDTLASIAGMIRSMRGFAELPETSTPSAALKEKLDAAGIGAKTPETATAVNKSGTSGQIEPIETTRTIALAGGAISFAGTGSGSQTVATITVNPLALADPNDQRAQRALDLSVTAPIDLQGGGQKLRFLGVRLRSNGTALYSHEKLDAASQRYASATGAFADSIEAALRSAPNVQTCFEGLVRGGKASKDECGSDFDDLQVRHLRETLYRELNEARRQADQYYWGLDLRLDIGDAGSADEDDEDDIHFLGGLAGGGRIPLGQWDLEYRARAAGDYFDPNDDDPTGNPIKPVFSADWGIGLVLAGRPTTAIAKQRLGFGLGLEGRHALKDDPTDLAPTNFVDLRMMVVVPTASGTDLSIGLSIPLRDSAVDRGSTITVSGDFGLLSPEGAAAL
ncbi:MAG: hypothetical protein ABI895_29345 [Deltaproteobacteria bacterium]